MKGIINIVIALIIATAASGQVKLDSFKIESKSFPKPSVNNFIHWLNLSTMEWEKEMKQFQFSDRGLNEGCIYYGSGSVLTDAVFTISKCPGNMVSCEWTNFANKSITKLDDLVNELEPFYKKRDENGNSIFALTHEDKAYIFTLHRAQEGEFVIVVKNNIN